MGYEFNQTRFVPLLIHIIRKYLPNFPESNKFPATFSLPINEIVPCLGRIPRLEIVNNENIQTHAVCGSPDFTGAFDGIISDRI